jgi:serine/threonine-protein kinase HipA
VIQKIKHLSVSTPQGVAGDLIRDSRFVFNYTTSERDREVSLTMPLRAESYGRSLLHPVFAMNKPEGWLQQKIVERMSKQTLVNDMRLLSIVGHNQIGRLSYAEPGAQLSQSAPTVGLTTLLTKSNSQEVFEFLVEQYLGSGISGVQPKVLIPDADRVPRERATAFSADLIVKSSGAEFPNLTVNEFLCMAAARRAGIKVPDFWLSDDRGLFVMQRFDVDGEKRLGFEDMAVLMGKEVDPFGRYKYASSYEQVVKAIGLYCRGDAFVDSTQRFFEYLALSVMVRNGDAHLKNFGLLYEHPSSVSSPTLAPLYDVVTTSIYDDFDPKTGRTISDMTLALKLRKSKSYPLLRALSEFGSGECCVAKPEQLFDRISAAMNDTLSEYRDLADRKFMDKLSKEWVAGIESLQPSCVFVSDPSVAPEDGSATEPPPFGCAP